jgi:hypothetical protein
MQTVQFWVGGSSVDQIEAILLNLFAEGHIDNWAPVLPQPSDGYYTVAFGPDTNVALVVLLTNSRL